MTSLGSQTPVCLLLLPLLLTGSQTHGLTFCCPEDHLLCFSGQGLMGQGSDSVVREASGPGESDDMRGRQKKCAVWQHGNLTPGIPPSQPLPPPISALSPAPSVTSVVTPVILTLPQEAGYTGSACSLPEAGDGGKGW